MTLPRTWVAEEKGGVNLGVEGLFLAPAEEKAAVTWLRDAHVLVTRVL